MPNPNTNPNPNPNANPNRNADSNPNVNFLPPGGRGAVWPVRDHLLCIQVHKVDPNPDLTLSIHHLRLHVRMSAWVDPNLNPIRNP